MPLVFNITVISSEVESGWFSIENVSTEYSTLKATFETTNEIRAGVGNIGVYLSVEAYESNRFSLTANVVGKNSKTV
jgi:hypothetical protein